MNYYNSSTRFEMVVEIANIALDEFKTHHITRNYTGLVQRYYQLVEEDYGGRSTACLAEMRMQMQLMQFNRFRSHIKCGLIIKLKAP